MSTLDDLIARVAGLPQEERAKLQKIALASKASRKWTPNPGPQTEAYFCKADVLLYGGEPGGGKAVSVHSLIPTPHGWSTMGDLRVGDQVFDERGAVCLVVAKSDVIFEPAYRLTFSDGEEIEADARHQWVTSTRAERMRRLKCTDEWRAKRRETRPTRGTGARPDLAARNSLTASARNPATSSIKTTQQIFDTVRRYDGGLNHVVEVAGALQLPDAELLIDPYVLGVWLGDGCKNTSQIVGLDEEIFANVANSYEVTRVPSSKYARAARGLITDIRRLGLFNNKHVPSAYLRASQSQRLALLQGLMDTDGHCDSRGQCEIQLTRKELIDGVAELLSSLGIKAQIREGDAKLDGRVTSKKWRLKFLTNLPAFRLARKLIRQKRSGFRGTHNARYIEKCEPIDPIQMQCIQVDSPSHCYLVGRSMIPTHNSQLILGLAHNEHKRSLIMRRQYGDLDRIVEDCLKIHGSRDGFNGSPPPKLRISDTQIIDFAAAHRVGDEQGQMGKGRDLLGIDEATHFAESQIRFLMGWNRSDDPKQRVRTVLATNPPLSAEGLWVIKMFAPWLDPQYPNPAKQGELRWVVSDADGNDRWVDGPGEYETVVAGKPKKVLATSRTYIPASVKDNPYYVASGYEQQLDAMPEPYRSLLMGGFRTAFRDADNQMIPTKWVQLAQERWKAGKPQGVPMCSMAVDASGGGDDPMVVASRYDGWFDHNQHTPGKEIPMERAGAFCAGVVVSHRRDGAVVTIDMGGGYGGPTYEHLYANEVEVKSYKGAEATTRRSQDGKLRFVNTRTAAYWLFREALDPGQPGGSPIALPPDPKLLADLTAPTFEPTPQGIKAEPKDKVCERLGRSTDDGDAVVMCWFNGPRHSTHAMDWIEMGLKRKESRNPKVVLGSRQPLSARRHA